MYYLLIYIFLAFLSLYFFKIKQKHEIIENLLWLNTIIFLIIFFGFRHNVGGDWWVYEKDFELIIKKESWYNLIINNSGRNEFAYYFLTILIKKLNLSFHYVNFILSILFFYCLHKFCSIQYNRFLALLISFPVLVLVISNGFVRQAVSISFFMLAIYNLCAGKKGLFFFWIIISSLFHITVIMFVPLYFIVNKSYSF